MDLTTIYLASIALLPLLLGALAAWSAVRRIVQPFTTRDLVTLALMIGLLHVAVLPFKGGLGRIPGLDALVYAIPYTAVLVLALRLVPKPGAAAALILGQALVGQLLGAGFNPAMWPYHLWCALAAECVAVAVGGRLQWLWQAVVLACVRGLVSNAYSYGLVAPLIWRKQYAPWYVATKIVLGLGGCLIGAVVAWRLAPRLERDAANPVG
jgi:hypothetical protein